jgi:hypothetical protein
MKMDIDRHGPRSMPNNCKNFNPPNFSLPTTFKHFSASKQYLYSHKMIATKIEFFAFRVHFGPLKLRYSQLLFYTFLHKIVGS